MHLMKDLVPILCHYHTRSKQVCFELLSDEFDVIKEDSDDTMEKENNSNELSKNKEQNVDMLEIALVVIDSPNNLLNVCQVLNNGGYTPITTDIMSNLNEEGKYYINLYWAIFDPIIYTADLENIILIVVSISPNLVGVFE